MGANHFLIFEVSITRRYGEKKRKEKRQKQKKNTIVSLCGFVRKTTTAVTKHLSSSPCLNFTRKNVQRLGEFTTIAITGMQTSVNTWLIIIIICKSLAPIW